MVEPLRHRQTKEAATAMFNLQPPRHISTLQILLQKSFCTGDQKFFELSPAPEAGLCFLRARLWVESTWPGKGCASIPTSAHHRPTYGGHSGDDSSVLCSRAVICRTNWRGVASKPSPIFFMAIISVPAGSRQCCAGLYRLTAASIP
jgi:hypothetical protein